MGCPQNRAVSAGLSQRRDLFPELILRHFPQDLFSEILCDRLHLRRNRSVVLCQVRVIGTGIDDAELIAAVRKGKRYFRDYRILFLLEVNGNCAADRAGHLVHQSAWLSEIYIFRILADFCDLYRIQCIRAEHMIEDHTDQGLKGCRRGQSGAAGDIRDDTGIEALRLEAALPDRRGDSPDQGSSLIDLFRMYSFIRDIDPKNIVPLRLQHDGAGPVRRRSGHQVQADTCRKNTAPLVVCVVAAQFRAAGRAVQSKSAGDR